MTTGWQSLNMHVAKSSHSEQRFIVNMTKAVIKTQKK